MFEKASKLKLRFATNKGFVTTEDLWDLKLEDLDRMAIAYSKEVKETQQESFIKIKTKSDERLVLTLDILKHIIEVKLQEKEEKAIKAKKAQEISLLENLLVDKKVEELKGLSSEEIQKKLVELKG